MKKGRRRRQREGWPKIETRPAGALTEAGYQRKMSQSNMKRHFFSLSLSLSLPSPVDYLGKISEQGRGLQ